MVEQTDKGNKTTVLYSGPTRESKVVLPLGEFHLFAEIHEEAEAFTIFDIEVKFPTYLPTQEEYEAYNITQKLANTRDEARIAQMLTADVKYKTFCIKIYIAK